jgi:hypothetical protein
MTLPMTASGLPARGRALRLALVVLPLLCAAGLAFAFVSYRRYAEVWLRPPPRMPGCVLAARRFLRHEEPVTGAFPHSTPNGSTVYLREGEDRAVRCVAGISQEFAAELSSALSEVDPGPRAQALLALVRTPRDRSADAEALAGYLIASAAVRALPEGPETKAVLDEMEGLNACRFAMRTPCPSRPAMPASVYAASVPAGLLLLVWLGLLARVIFVWRREKKQAHG